MVGNASFAWFHAANVATAGYPMLTLANANLVAKFGTPEQIDRFVRPMLAGRFHGTMALSEPQAGSSLADIVTRAEPQADGSYRVIGSKMWISGGEHDLGENIVHLVLAKIPGGPVGTKGISLFLVPKILVGDNGELGERNDVVLAGLNHKMGFRGTVNTVLNFGEGRYTPDGKPGAVGYLIGEAHRGLQYMFHMMNEARLGVGLGATALGYTGFLEVARIRAQSAAGPTAHREGRRHPADPDRRARGRAPDAARAEVLRGGRARAQPVLRPPGRPAAHRRIGFRARRGDAAARQALKAPPRERQRRRRRCGPLRAALTLGRGYAGVRHPAAATLARTAPSSANTLSMSKMMMN